MNKIQVYVRTVSVKKLTKVSQRQSGICEFCHKNLYQLGQDYYSVNVNSFSWSVCGECGEDGVLKVLRTLAHEKVTELRYKQESVVTNAILRKYEKLAKVEIKERLRKEQFGYYDSFRKALQPFAKAEYERMKEASKDTTQIVKKRCARCQCLKEMPDWTEVCLDCWTAYHQEWNDKIRMGFGQRVTDARVSSLEQSRGVKELHRTSIRYNAPPLQK